MSRSEVVMICIDVIGLVSMVYACVLSFQGRHLQASLLGFVACIAWLFTKFGQKLIHGRRNEMSDIEKKKSAFMALLEKRAEIWNVRGCFYGLVEKWFEENDVDENGIADIKVSLCVNADLGDELFDTMYEVESRLKCSTNCIKMQYRHEPRTIDGVVFVALANPLDINWRVDIGAISVDEEKKDEEKK